MNSHPSDRFERRQIDAKKKNQGKGRRRKIPETRNENPQVESIEGQPRS